MCKNCKKIETNSNFCVTCWRHVGEITAPCMSCGDDTTTFSYTQRCYIKHKCVKCQDPISAHRYHKNMETIRCRNLQISAEKAELERLNLEKQAEIERLKLEKQAEIERLSSLDPLKLGELLYDQLKLNKDLLDRLSKLETKVYL